MENMSFTYDFDGEDDGASNVFVNMNIHAKKDGDLMLTDIVKNFESFLRSAGYEFDKLIIENDE